MIFFSSCRSRILNPLLFFDFGLGQQVAVASRHNWEIGIPILIRLRPDSLNRARTGTAYASESATYLNFPANSIARCVIGSFY